MVKIHNFFFKSYTKCFISEVFFYRFRQILFSFARTFAVHREKGFVAAFLRSVCITYLITSSLGKEIIVLENNFGFKNL